MTHLTFRQWLHITFAWLLLTIGFVLWLWAPVYGSILGLLLMVFTSHYAFTTRQARRAALDQQVDKRELVLVTAALILIVALLIFLELQGGDAESFDVKEKLREPLSALALYALLVSPTAWRWYRLLTRARSEPPPGTEP